MRPLFLWSKAMSDDKKKTADDRKRIDIRQPYEIGYWSRKFGVSREQLSEAVQSVGPIAEDVARELGK